MEITFTNPIYLWFLLSIPLTVITHFYLLRHAKKKAMKFANFETLRRITGKKLITKNIPILINRCLILLFVILGVSGSIFWYSGDSNRSNFVIAIDTSASMTAEDIYPTRLEAAKEYAIKFVELLKSDTKISVITFAGVTEIEQTPTRNKLYVQKAINEIEQSRAGGTDIPGAIVTGTNLLAGSEKGKTMIMITDGSSTIGAYVENSIKLSTGYAQDNHVIIHTIGTGTKNEEPIGYIPEYYNISSVYNEKILIEISNSTTGKYFHAADQQLLVNAFTELSKDSDRALLNLELTPGLMALSMILLFLEWGLINTKYKKIP